MPDIVLALGVLILSYLLGSIPFGLVIVRLVTGKDVRKHESGRTGGTNVGRVAGFWAGLATAFLDGMKALVCVVIATQVQPENAWLHVLAPVLAVIGHNYSIYLTERTESGGFRLRGGAGGAATVGGAVGLWPPSVLIILPVGAFVLLGIGYASLATLSVGLTATIIFAVRAMMGSSSWSYVFYGIFVEIILIIALRPNIQRLMNGTERVVGWRAKRKKTDSE